MPALNLQFRLFQIAIYIYLFNLTGHNVNQSVIMPGVTPPKSTNTFGQQTTRSRSPKTSLKAVTQPSEHQRNDILPISTAASLTVPLTVDIKTSMSMPLTNNINQRTTVPKETTNSPSTTRFKFIRWSKKHTSISCGINCADFAAHGRSHSTLTTTTDKPQVDIYINDQTTSYSTLQASLVRLSTNNFGSGTNTSPRMLTTNKFLSAVSQKEGGTMTTALRPKTGTFLVQSTNSSHQTTSQTKLQTTLDNHKTFISNDIIILRACGGFLAALVIALVVALCSKGKIGKRSKVLCNFNCRNTKVGVDEVTNEVFPAEPKIPQRRLPPILVTTRPVTETGNSLETGACKEYFEDSSGYETINPMDMMDFDPISVSTLYLRSQLQATRQQTSVSDGYVVGARLATPPI